MNSLPNSIEGGGWGAKVNSPTPALNPLLHLFEAGFTILKGGARRGPPHLARPGGAVDGDSRFYIFATGQPFYSFSSLGGEGKELGSDRGSGLGNHLYPPHGDCTRDRQGGSFTFLIRSRHLGHFFVPNVAGMRDGRDPACPSHGAIGIRGTAPAHGVEHHWRMRRVMSYPVVGLSSG
ncbi:hypothetical protein SUGI_1225550 [Cryptomeria japonica]|uniref:Uncharacterized protein n=1 Tax=Cryptomeria japonica TaxID=3369 RepID=A0AAD3NMW8_CRYJA|nr:hypothetical protein SUGI_1225550 [Cryptomeria japonica]